MKTAVIKFKTYAGNVKMVSNDEASRKILNMIIVFFGSLALVYVLILGSMIWNIVERKSLETGMRNLSNEVGSLELEYLAQSNKVDLSLGYSLGFKETKAKFTTKKSLGFNSFSGGLNSEKVKNEI